MTYNDSNIFAQIIDKKLPTKIILENEHSNIRTELAGLPNIQHYCKYNNITNPKYSPAASALGENPRQVLPSIL